ncbi:MAG: 50S ribosomal protein L13 [Candidatus Sumerlaeota bacterium]
MKTYTPKANEIEERWYLVDADGQTVGRLASRIALVLRGKNDPRFSPHVNMRNHVVVINAEKVRFSGNKMNEKKYYRHSNWPGGIQEATPKQLLKQKPTEILRHAVWGMLPKNRLGRATMKRLRLFVGPEHHHAAQRPEPLELVK